MKNFSIMLTLLALAFFQACSAGAGPGVDPIQTVIGTNTDYDLKLNTGNTHNSEIYKSALVFIEEIKASSSCHQLAVSTLISVCQAMDDPSPLDLALTDIKEEYAAKMAVCELAAVGVKSKDAIPKACKGFMPTKDACPKSNSQQPDSSKICYFPLTRAKVTSCITALESRSQSWTSYSNALQNVANTCQVSRLGQEKDQYFEQVKILLEKTAVASAKTTEAIRHLVELGSANVNNFQTLVHTFEAAIRERAHDFAQDIATRGLERIDHVQNELANQFANNVALLGTLFNDLLGHQDQALSNMIVLKDGLEQSAIAIQDTIDMQAVAREQVASLITDVSTAGDDIQAGIDLLYSNLEAVHNITTDHNQKLQQAIVKADSLYSALTDLMSLFSAPINALHSFYHVASNFIKARQLTRMSVVFNLAVASIVIGHFVKRIRGSLTEKLVIVLMMQAAQYMMYRLASSSSAASHATWMYTSPTAGIVTFATYALSLALAARIVDAINRVLSSLRRPSTALFLPATTETAALKGLGAAQGQSTRHTRYARVTYTGPARTARCATEQPGEKPEWV